MNSSINLLPPGEQELRLAKLNPEAPMLFADPANLFYLTGRIFAGYMLVEPGCAPRYYIKRPLELDGENVVYIRKPEDIARDFPGGFDLLGLELCSMPAADAMRIQKGLAARELFNASTVIMNARAVKTPFEVSLLEEDGVKQSSVYQRIPRFFRQGMTDIELQATIEYQLRLQGCLGIFRVNGPMELHMGSVLTGENADSPSPYDFAMGGHGISPALPVGASGEEIKPGGVVMVDMNGCFNGYMTDMTRMYCNAQSASDLDPKVIAAWRCSVEICRTLAAEGKPGVEAKALYERALEIARLHKLEAYFMGHRQHAGFVGHGIGITVNEAPVLAPRSKAILTEGNVIAIEPKFVIPGFGAIGIENTYVVTADGMRCLTLAPEEITPLL